MKLKFHWRTLAWPAALISGCLILMACTPPDQPQQSSAPAPAPQSPIKIILSGYGPPTSSFSQGLTLIGERMQSKFGDRVEVHYVYNILDLGYDGANVQLDMVEKDILTLGYVTMSDNIPALEVASMPFLFADNESVRTAMDGALGEAAIQSIEANSGLKILGFYENGFRHVSNNTRPVHKPEDFRGLKIRALAIQIRTLELLGAAPLETPLPLVLAGLESGELDGQENPFENVVTYGMYKYQKYYTKTYHSYLSRPIFVNRATFDAWPLDMQQEFRLAVKDAVAFQRDLHDQAEIDAEQVIRDAGGEIVELSKAEHDAFFAAVAPIYADAKQKYSDELLGLVGL